MEKEIKKQEETIRLTILGKEHSYAAGTTYQEIAADYRGQYADDILLVLNNNRLRELNHRAESGTLTFVTAAEKAGRKAYRRSVTLLLQKAVHNLYTGKKLQIHVRHSIGQGYYCETDSEAPIEFDREALLRIKLEMMRLADQDLPITKRVIPTDEAVALFGRLGMKDKESLFRYRRSSNVNIYDLDGYVDYYYGYMVPSTGYLKYFDLLLYQKGFMLLFPDRRNTRMIPEFRPSNQLFRTLAEAVRWGDTMGISTVGALNDAVAAGRLQEIILIQEALMERKIGSLAETIAARPENKFIMIAGPSSSGKTTFSHRLSIQLAALGMKPHPVPLDDYYLDRSLTPRDENGNYDFECLEALDVERFNQDMSRLLAGEEVELPIFNFKTGKREPVGRKMKLGQEDVLVIEGIHGLNDKLSYALPRESKFRIYISPLTQLNIDEHNCLPTTDGRLLRRIVRDARTRDTAAEDTIAMWPSVRRGEEKYIFPFQEEADVMFNSAHIYELSVLKIYAEPLLSAIDRSSPEYIEAKRLLKFLDYFLPVSGEQIGPNSIIREFIGGSCFHV
ncbi:MAG: nucleoside kinase [Lachnospiraceae bacterium]|nr:nucleoside kinase [Lachnospiraceae bacterium]